MPEISMDRPLDPGEAFFFLSDRLSCMNFVFLAERRGHLDAGRIRGALAVIQQENPLLQASIRWTAAEGLRFAPAPGVPLDLECREVAADDWHPWIERELSRPFAEGVAPLVRCLYLSMPAPAGCVLALCFHHAIADGRSGDALMRRLLELIASGGGATQGNVMTALPPMHEAFPARFQWAGQPAAAKQLTDAMMADYLRHGAPPPVPWLSRHASERAPRFVRLRLAPELTRRLVSRCRAHGTSVHGALCAAQLLAQFRLQPGADATTFFLSCPVDMRPHLEPVQPATPTGLYVTMIAAAFAMDARTDLWALAREVITQTRLQLDRGEGHLFFHLHGLDAVPIAPDRMARFSKGLLSTWHHTMVSNIGRVATVAADPEVEAISFVLCPMPYQTAFSAASTYRDQLIVNLGYDAARVTEADAGALARGMQALLLEAASAVPPG